MEHAFPENFTTLHKGEEQVRALSIQAIENNPDLHLHVAVVEKSADFVLFLFTATHRDEDDLTIRLLGIRLFNGMSAALKMLLSGYYQVAALQIRDLIKTLFLLDLLQTDKALISQWRNADEDTRWKRFSPAKVRKALDTRDSLIGKRRGKLYALFSNLAGHPNPAGFALLRLADGSHHCGPFFEASRLDATLSELAQAALQAGTNFGSFFHEPSTDVFSARVSFWEHLNLWFEHFYGRTLIAKTEIDEIKSQIAQL